MKILNESQPFLITNNFEIKELLLAKNFVLLSENDGKFTFLNNSDEKFDTKDNEAIKNKICYTNVLYMS